MRQSLRLSSKCEDHFFNSSLNLTSQTFLSLLVSANRDLLSKSTNFSNFPYLRSGCSTLRGWNGCAHGYVGGKYLEAGPAGCSLCPPRLVSVFSLFFLLFLFS